MNVLPGIGATASALQAEKVRMDIVAENIGNAHTTRGVDGKAYQRKMVSFASMLDSTAPGGAAGLGGVKVSSIKPDSRPGAVIYDPQHPDADGNGMVHMPNVNVAFEMVDLINATRSYEANLAVVRNAKQMAHKALTIGH